MLSETQTPQIQWRKFYSRIYIWISELSSIAQVGPKMADLYCSLTYLELFKVACSIWLPNLKSHTIPPPPLFSSKALALHLILMNTYMCVEMKWKCRSKSSKILTQSVRLMQIHKTNIYGSQEMCYVQFQYNSSYDVCRAFSTSSFNSSSRSEFMIQFPQPPLQPTLLPPKLCPGMKL